MKARSVHVAVVFALSIAALAAAWRIVEFGETRFFGIDEYQYGHATWLVANGALPYVDFFEHHFPLSYVLHAPLFLPDWSFATAALLLRRIAAGTLLAAAALTGFGAWFATRSASVALLSAFLPTSFGFVLMSGIEYRSENFGAFYLLGSLLLLEWNRRRDNTRLAVFCGVLAALAACMTQKTTFVAGVTFAAMWAVDQIARAFGDPHRLPLLARKTAFFSAAVGTGLALLGVAFAFGIAGPGFETTITQALEHERLYERFSIFGRGYVDAFWETTWISTTALLLFAAGYLATPAGRFWAFPIGASLVGGALMVAPYPYNFVLLCWVVVLAAVRGFGLGVAWIGARACSFAAVAPLLYLLAVPVLANQLAYTADAISNAHQLETLAKIEEFGDPEDAVLDNAGGAMFSPDGSYYYHHGAAHRVMFRDYFATQLVGDYRESRALFWIRDLRTKHLPQPTQDYLESHYIRGDGDLYVLGFETESTGADAATTTIDVIRAGDYYFHRANRPPREHPKRPTDLLLDDQPVRTNHIFLAEREYTLTSLPHSPRYLITPVKASFFARDHEQADDTDEQTEKRPRFSMMFQHKGSRGGEEDEAAAD